MLSDNKNAPSAAWLDALRARYPLDGETDAVLTRKMRLRASGPYQPVPIETLIAGVRALLKSTGENAPEIHDARWLAGGASKIQMAFTLAGPEPRRCVLRMEPAASVVETSRRQEFEVLSALRGVVPVPEPLWLDADAQFFPYPALIYAFADGVATPTDASSNVSNLGINFGPARRRRLAPQFVRHLARVHSWDWQNATLPAFEVPNSPSQAIEWQLNKWERVWLEDCGEDVPLVRLAARHLRDHMPQSDQISMLHGDYRAGNFLFTEADDQISALLDWELAHLGDRHEDLALISLAALGHTAEDGHTFLVGGMYPEAEFFQRYEQDSGLGVIPSVLQYYRIYNAYRVAVNLIASAYRVASGEKTHQDLLLVWIMGMGYRVLADLHALLEEG